MKDRAFLAPKPAHGLWRALPHMITLAALASGMWAMFLASDGRITEAIGCIVLAGLLDGCDGRVARLVGASSPFGAELDSLSDVVCFGVAPAFVLHMWAMDGAGALGWIVGATYAAATALRLARFNVMAQNPARPVWSSAFFEGVPSPAGAFLALFPIYLQNAGWLSPGQAQTASLIWLPLTAFLMVSRIPTFSGKLLGAVMRRAVFLVCGFSLLFGFVLVSEGVWTCLSLAVAAYFAMMPLSMLRHQVLSARRIDE
jgi:CDP-diacylglycerol---serine O-phosphatidyltransferase